VITGAASGLGRAYARRLARDGADVVLADIDDAGETAGLVLGEGGRALDVVCDVSSPDAVGELRALTYQQFGRCDILINNAGIYPRIAWQDLDYAAWRRILSVNLDGMFLTCKAFADGMIANRFGRIVNISSNTVALGIPNFSAYITSKAAVIGLTRALAAELGDSGITVNCVLPGLTMTPAREGVIGPQELDAVAAMQSIKRRAVPEDLDGVVSFLAGPDAGWITAQAIVVDGGHVRH
jgi:NAD(P)-dependent dehydrogenase (short-subunit alcohol dehydrogenase family)